MKRLWLIFAWWFTRPNIRCYPNLYPLGCDLYCRDLEAWYERGKELLDDPPVMPHDRLMLDVIAKGKRIGYNPCV